MIWDDLLDCGAATALVPIASHRLREVDLSGSITLVGSARPELAPGGASVPSCVEAVWVSLSTESAQASSLLRVIDVRAAHQNAASSVLSLLDSAHCLLRCNVHLPRAKGELLSSLSQR
jgi:hypothetical protein